MEVKCPVDSPWICPGTPLDALSASNLHAVGNEVYQIAEWILSNLSWNVVLFMDTNGACGSEARWLTAGEENLI